MKIKTFQDLIVWQKGHNLVIAIYKITRSFPPEEKYGIASQIRRSAASICANIAEGFKKSRKEFVRFIDIAQGSLEETKYHLILSKDLGYLSKNNYIQLLGLSNEVGRMLNALRKKLINW